MMVDVQNGHLIGLFAQHKEKCLKQVHQFVDKVQVSSKDCMGIWWNAGEKPIAIKVSTKITLRRN